METGYHVSDGEAQNDRHQRGYIFESADRYPLGDIVSRCVDDRNGWKADIRLV